MGIPQLGVIRFKTLNPEISLTIRQSEKDEILVFNTGQRQYHYDFIMDHSDLMQRIAKAKLVGFNYEFQVFVKAKANNLAWEISDNVRKQAFINLRNQTVYIDEASEMPDVSLPQSVIDFKTSRRTIDGIQNQHQISAYADFLKARSIEDKWVRRIWES